MPSFASYLDILNEGPDNPEYSVVTRYTSYLEYEAASLQRLMDSQLLEGTQWKPEPYKAPEGFETIELSKDCMIVDGMIHRFR